MASQLKRREFLVQSGKAVLGLPMLGTVASAADRDSGFRTARRRQNILYIMADDHSSHAISAYGSRINETTNIDRIGQGGARLDNCFCTNAICTPSRASIMAGQYGHINGVRGWDNIDSRRPIQTQKLLQAAGYNTAMIGKWHLGRGVTDQPASGGQPADKVPHDPAGFDYWEIMPGQGNYNDPVFYTAEGQKKYPSYATEITTNLALQWLKTGRDQEKPFYLCVHQKAPHRNWVPAQKYAHLFDGQEIPQPESYNDDYQGRPAGAAAKMQIKRDMTLTDTKGEKMPAGLSESQQADWHYQNYIKDYLRCIQSVDDSVGQLLDYLDQSGLTDDTIVIYTSDQGFFMGEHGWFDKRFIYEESLRMPFMIRYPREIKKGSVRKEFLTNIDFAPTLLDYARVGIPPEMQGSSGCAMLGGHKPKDWQNSMYYRYWVNGDEHNTAAHYGVRTATHKLVYFYAKPLGVMGATEMNPSVSPYWELYDLRRDPHEMHNIYDDPSKAPLIAGLKIELVRLQTKSKDEPVV